MAKLSATPPDIRELKLGLALLLTDGFTRANQLVGKTIVRSPDNPSAPFQKSSEATFLFFDLEPGAHVVEIRSDEDTPYYQNRDIQITVLQPSSTDTVPPAEFVWPAFPDIALADRDKPLDDPTQPAAYRKQRAAATLLPSTAYPFPAGTTLVRGTVRDGNDPLADAKVRRVNDDFEYVTGENGEFVFFFSRLKGLSETVTLRVTHPLHPDVDQDIDVRRGETVVANIDVSS